MIFPFLIGNLVFDLHACSSHSVCISSSSTTVRCWGKYDDDVRERDAGLCAPFMQAFVHPSLRIGNNQQRGEHGVALGDWTRVFVG